MAEDEYEDYINMNDVNGHPKPVESNRRSSRNSHIDDPYPMQEASTSLLPASIRMRNARESDATLDGEEEIYEILHDYTARSNDELSLKRGSTVRVVNADAENGWKLGIVNGREGLLPSNYIKAVGPCNFVRIKPSEIQVSKEMGEGASGRVFYATYRGMKVALKKMKWNRREGDKDGMEQAIDDVKNEAAYFSNFNHDNIVRLHGVCLESPHIGLVLELCEGGSLSQVYGRVINAAVPKRIIVDWALQIATAMEAICAKFVHRDLKMENVLVLQKVCFCALPEGALTPDRVNKDLYCHDNIQLDGTCSECGGTAFDRLRLKLTDFGLTRETTYNFCTAAGSAPYIAPESYMRMEYSEMSDVYSFGVVLWELITRKKPYEGCAYDLLPFLVAKGLRTLTVTSEFPQTLAGLIKRCLSMEPENRPRFTEIRQILQSYLDELLKVNEDPLDCVSTLGEQLYQDFEKITAIDPSLIEQYAAEMKILMSQAIRKAPEPPERRKGKIGKTEIGQPTDMRVLMSLTTNTITRNRGQHAPLRGTLSKSQPNLNQITSTPSSSSNGTAGGTMQRHFGMRKKKQPIPIEGYLAPGEGYDPSDDPVEVAPGTFSASHGESSSTLRSGDATPLSPQSEKRGSDGCVQAGTLKKSRGLKGKFRDFFHGKPSNQKSAPRNSSMSIDSDDASDTNSQRSMSLSTTRSGTMLVNSSNLPVSVGFSTVKKASRSPDLREDQDKKAHRTTGFQHTENTRTYTKQSPSSSISTPLSPYPPSSSSTSVSPSTATSSSENPGYLHLSHPSRPGPLAAQQPFHPAPHASSYPPPMASSTSSGTPVGIDEEYPPPGVFSPYHPDPQPYIIMSKGPPELPPRKRTGERHGGHAELKSELSMVVPVGQSSPTEAPPPAIPNGHRNRSRTVSTTSHPGRSSPVSDPTAGYSVLPLPPSLPPLPPHLPCVRSDPGPYIDLPSSARVALKATAAAAITDIARGVRTGTEEEEEEWGRSTGDEAAVANPSYEPYKRLVNSFHPGPLPREPPVIPPRNGGVMITK